MEVGHTVQFQAHIIWLSFSSLIHIHLHPCSHTSACMRIVYVDDYMSGRMHGLQAWVACMGCMHGWLHVWITVCMVTCALCTQDQN